jgi:16S rRNA processing protein RimM
MGAGQAEERIVLGRISGVFGVKGWLKVWSFTDPIDAILDHENWWLRLPEGWQAHRVDAGQRQGKGLVVHLAGCDDRDSAGRLVHAEVAVPAARLPELPEGEYYWYQLEGLRVLSEFEGAGKVLLGKIDHLFETGANDVIVVRPCEGSIDERERLVPWVRKEVVLSVDLQRKELRVDWDPAF